MNYLTETSVAEMSWSERSVAEMSWSETSGPKRPWPKRPTIVTDTHTHTNSKFHFNDLS